MAVFFPGVRDQKQGIAIRQRRGCGQAIKNGMDLFQIRCNLDSVDRLPVMIQPESANTILKGGMEYEFFMDRQGNATRLSGA